MKSLVIGPAIAVLFFHTAASAQQLPGPRLLPPVALTTASVETGDLALADPAPPAAPAPQPYATPPGPPPSSPPPPPPNGPPPPPYDGQPGYGQPGPGYPYGPPPGYRPAPRYYYYPPPPAHRGVYRPFTLSVGMGAGALSLPGRPRETDGGYNYTARIGFGLTPNFVVFLGVDGMGISQPNFGISQTNYLIGAQAFLVPRLYLRGGVGVATLSVDDDFFGYSLGTSAGQAFLGGVGLELLQGDSVSFGVEWNTSLGHFHDGSYVANGLTALLSFY